MYLSLKSPTSCWDALGDPVRALGGELSVGVADGSAGGTVVEARLPVDTEARPG